MSSQTAESSFLHIRSQCRGVLTTAVRESWLVRAERCRTAVERVLPDAGAEIYFNLGPRGRHLFGHGKPGPTAPRNAWVVGPHAAPLLIAKEVADCDMVGVRLRPAVAEQLLGASARELRDRLVDLDALWGNSVETIRDRLNAVGDPRARLHILEELVADRLRRTGANRDALLARSLCASLTAVPSMSVADAAAAHRLSHRRAIALVERYVGFTPKRLQRIQRLRRVLRYVHQCPRLSWAGIAGACGYFDQAHLINDFRQQTGITPLEYAERRSSVGRGFLPFLLAGQSVTEAPSVRQEFPIAS